jgi:type IV secretory pathway VirJ component
MKIKSFLFILLCSTGILFGSNAYPGVIKDSLNIQPFGTVYLFIPDKTPPESVIILISGDGGFRYGVVRFSEHFALQNSLVIGVNIRKYYAELKSRKEQCYHIVSDFVTLASSVEKKYKLPEYQEPVLMGYSSGATLVYAILAQSRPHTFKGGISLGFCPDVELPKHFCELNGLKQHPIIDGNSFDLDPDSRLGDPWIVLQGRLDKICDFQKTAEFIQLSSDAELIELENVGHGFTKWTDFMPQWDRALQSILAQKPDKPDDENMAENELINKLPLTITPATKVSENTPMVFFISGDGGWYSFEQNLSGHLAEAGVPTVGLDAKKYFWNRRTPQESAQDIANILNHFSEIWKKNKILLMGYSQGAEILPFIYEQFSQKIRNKVEQMILLSPNAYTDFEIHISNMIGIGNFENTYNVVQALKSISNLTRILIITGDEENSSLHDNLSDTGINFATVRGDHHYNNDSHEIFDFLKEKNVLFINFND